MPSDRAKPRYQDAQRRISGLANNILIEGKHHAKLLCGHTVIGYPVASLNGRGWYRCDECDSLVKEKSKS